MSDAKEPEHSATAGEGVIDEVTGLPNRAGWDSVLEMEERRCRRYGGDPGVVAVEVKGSRPGLHDQPVAPAALLQLVADTLGRTSRDTDAIARVAPRRFAVLATEGGESIAALEARLRIALEVVGVTASVHARARRSWTDLREAWRHAEAAAEAVLWIAPAPPAFSPESPSRN